MTMRALQNAITGHYEREERAERAAWERARWLAAATLAPYAAKGKTIKPTDLARFPWEKEAGPPKRKPLTPEQIEFRRKLDEKMKRLHGGTTGS